VISVQLFAFGSVANAITNGQPDGDNHPYVCMVVFDYGGGPAWRTTGFFISPTVVITAAHGVYGAEAARVWTNTDMTTDPYYPFGGGDAIEAASIHYHPDYRVVPANNGLPEFSYHDVGVVILSESVVLSEYAQLPTAGQVDGLKMMASVDAVGYGVQWQDKSVNRFLGPLGIIPPPYFNWTWDYLRHFATANAVMSKHVISDEFLVLTANPGKGMGGTAFGDSGGPILISGTDTVLAINSFVTNFNCAGVTYAQRIDIPDILNWIDSFLP
jgi:hypothetical protein